MNRVLGIDLGKARIGLAISDELLLLAHPLETVAANEQSLGRIVEIVHEEKIGHVVVGIPRQMNGEIGPAAKDALRFVEKLQAFLSCEVITWDERWTTAAANRALHEAGKKTRQTRHYIDQVAAQMILQGYLDRRQESNARETTEQ